MRRGLLDLFEQVRAERCRASASLIARAEVLVLHLRLGQVPLADSYRTLLSMRGPITVLPVEPPVVDRAVELRADYPMLKLPDVLHIATAVHNACDVFITGDHHLAALSARVPILTLDRLRAH